MEEFFKVILSMSITASFCMVLVCLLRGILKRTPKIYSYLLWSIVAFRLVCPIALESNIGIVTSPFLQQYEGVELKEEKGNALIPSTNKTQSIVNVNEQEQVVKPEIDGKTMVLPRVKVELFSILSYLWLGIVIVLVGCSSIRYVRLKRQLRRHVLEESEYKEVRVLKVATLSTPFVLGILKPVIYLPEGLPSNAEKICLSHEYTHIKRRDYFVKIFAYGIACIHWFNPFVWLSFYLMEKDMEMSCDEAVLKSTDIVDKKAYSEVLLQLSNHTRTSFAGCQIFFGESGISLRIKNIMKFKKPKFWVRLVVIIIVITCIFILGVNRKPDRNASNQKQALGTPVVTTPAVMKTPKTTTTPKVTISPNVTSSPKVSTTPQPTQNSNTEVVMGIKSISEDGKLVTEYSIRDTYDSDGKPIHFAKDCVYMANKSMSTLSFEEITHDKFVGYIGNVENSFYKDCIVSRNNQGEISSVKLLSVYDNYGITYLLPSEWDDYKDLKELAGDNVLKEFYKPVFTSLLLSSNWPKNLILEVYTGDIGDGNSGVVLIKNEKGEILHSEFAHSSRDSWNNVYYGMDEKGAFIMSFLIDSRDNEGGCSYRVYRLNKKEQMVQTESSSFEFGSSVIYDETLFKQWMVPLEAYMKHSQRLLSTQEGELRTEQISEYDKYNYETLRDITNWRLS